MFEQDGGEEFLAFFPNQRNIILNNHPHTQDISTRAKGSRYGIIVCGRRIDKT